jgi:biopolymer transport protein ExbD
MRRHSSKNGLHTLTELNITPMLDLVFVLLIIFMITTPLIENSMDLVVPKSSTAAGTSNPSETFNISIDKNNVLKINNDLITPEDLEARLAALRLEKPDTAVVVRPHFELPIQKFIAVMDILQRVGINKVGVMTLKDQPEAGAQKR